MLATANATKLAARVVIECKEHALIYTGKIEMVKDPGISGLGGGGHLDCYIKLQSPRKHKSQRIQILISDREKSNFPRLATQSERIVFRVRAGAIDEETKFLYESEVSNAFSPDQLGDAVVCVSELDTDVDLPPGPLPKFPEALLGDSSFRNATSKYLVFIDEKGKLLKAIPTLKMHPEIDKASRLYLDSAKFKRGKKDKEPAAYYTTVAIRFFKNARAKRKLARARQTPKHQTNHFCFHEPGFLMNPLE